MSVQYLDLLFKPNSLAIIGASREPNSMSAVLMQNIMAGKFLGPVLPVSGVQEAILGVLSYVDITALPLTPDLAILCCPIFEVPEYLAKLADSGTHAALIMDPGYGLLEAKERAIIDARIQDVVQQKNIRVLGPGSLGMIVPGAGVNVSLSRVGAKEGRIAFVTQSDSLFESVLEWAKTNNVGFSHCISLGRQLDVDFSSVLDYLGSDPATKAILLYVETIQDARRFMSAARASARTKPILVIHPRRLPCHLRDAASDLTESDLDHIYDAAFRRAGMVRVQDIDSLFEGARTLANYKPVRGNGLAIMTNGQSIGLLTADALIDGGGRLAPITDETQLKLEEILGPERCSDNPVTLPYNATADMYARVLSTLVRAKDVGCVLILHVPFQGTSSLEIAQAVAQVAKNSRCLILASWLGEQTVQETKEVFDEATIPVFDRSGNAVTAYLHMLRYKRTQQILMQTPDSLPTDFFPDTDRALEIIKAALADGRSQLFEEESRQVLAAYGVPVVETRICKSAMQAVEAASEIGFPVALKIRSPQIAHPFDIGGIALDLTTPDRVFEAAANMSARVHAQVPNAYIEGFTVQKMGRRPGAHELFISVFTDETFGPVIRFGHGGVVAPVINDQAVALPPLNMSLAKELIFRTRISKLLEGSRRQAATDIDDICLALIQISQMVIDLPQIVTMEMNPIFADDRGVLALGAHIWIQPAQSTGPERLAIRPYPRELEECVRLNNGQQLLLRPIRPEDAKAHLQFIQGLSEEDLRLRFFGLVQNFDLNDMPKFTQIDYDREMAFVATHVVDGESETLGVVRTSTKPDNSSAEFAIIVRSDMKGTGLGSLLFEKMIRYCKSRGTRYLDGQTMPRNKGMIGLAKRFGLSVSHNYEEELVEMRLPLWEWEPVR
ncbi:MAG: bifunctional acetate--CoA ligase family protein/GNAT family N-acetyltransferase [Desulfomicrobium sp.]|nr:bifunctional acetate--CoA ligase family protein/GNAT family N-acetyltransferase [Desulfomicrobium sp.]